MDFKDKYTKLVQDIRDILATVDHDFPDVDVAKCLRMFVLKYKDLQKESQPVVLDYKPIEPPEIYASEGMPDNATVIMNPIDEKCQHCGQTLFQIISKDGHEIKSCANCHRSSGTIKLAKYGKNVF